MTLIITQNGVVNTSSTEVSVGGKVVVGKDLKNDGKFNVNEPGELIVLGELSNTIEFNINKQNKIGEGLVETIKTIGKVADAAGGLIKK